MKKYSSKFSSNYAEIDNKTNNNKELIFLSQIKYPTKIISLMILEPKSSTTTHLLFCIGMMLLRQ